MLEQPPITLARTEICQETPAPLASLPAISGTFNSLLEVPLAFPSWYLFAISLEPRFSFRLEVTQTTITNTRSGTTVHEPSFTNKQTCWKLIFLSP